MVHPVKATIDVSAAQPLEDLHTLFSKCGPIRSVSAWTDPNLSNEHHYFVEFYNERSVQLADAHKPTGSTVRLLSAHPELSAHFARVVGAGMDIDPPPSAGPSATGNTDGSPATPTAPPTPRTSEPDDPSRQALQSAVARTFSTSRASTNTFLRGLRETERSQRPARDYRSDMRPPPVPTTLSHPPFSTRPPVLITGPHPTSSTSAPTDTLEGMPDVMIQMTLFGEQITYDLKTLDDDPAAIMVLLEKSASTRANWMLVAGYYRQKGLFKAAAAVGSTMIEVMKKMGLSDTDLKPAYLFLSSCHTDLGKRARSSTNGQHQEAAEGHYRESKRLLQQVYGTQSMEPGQPSPSFSSSSPSSSSPHSRKHSDARAPAIGPSSAQRELQSLRDRNDHLTRAARKAERALDDLDRDLSDERVYRRKVQTRVDDLEREADARRRTVRALEDALAKEKEGRRRAEEALAAERGRWGAYGSGQPPPPPPPLVSTGAQNGHLQHHSTGVPVGGYPTMSKGFYGNGAMA